jgi:ketosteroid isomerase-like protein
MGDDAELVRRGYGLWNERGPGGLSEFLHEDGEVSDPPDMIDGKTTHGREAFVEHWEERLKDLDISLAIDEIAELGEGRVLLVISITAAGSGTGISFEEQHAHLIELREGKIYRVQIYRDLPAARREAGLPADG